MIKIKRTFGIAFVVIYLLLFTGQINNLVLYFNGDSISYWGSDFLKIVRRYEIIFYCLVIFSSFFMKNVNSIEIGLKPNFQRNIKIFIISLSVIILSSYFINYCLLYFFESYTGSSKSSFFYNEYSYIYYVFLTFFSAHTEEIIYRKYFFGILYDLFEGCNENVKFLTSSLISGIIFGWLHDGFFNYGMIYYVIISVIFSYQYKCCKNIYLVGLTHHMMNIILMGLYYLFN